MGDDRQPQVDKFKEVAKQIGADEDEARWGERMRKIAAAKPKPPTKKD